MRNQTKKSHCRHYHDRFDVRRGLLLHHHLLLLLLLLVLVLEEGPCVKIVHSFQPIPILRRTTSTTAARRRGIKYNSNSISNNKPQLFFDRSSPSSRRNPVVLSAVASTSTTATTLLDFSGGPLRLAAIAGLISAGLQWTISFLLKNQKRESTILLKETAEYTSHSIVALGLMLLLSGLGIYHWWWIMPATATSTTATTTASRILIHSPTGEVMASIVLGCFVAWDIPTSFRVKALRKADVIIHHCVMSLLALLGCTILPMQYILYYFGVVELSSIPLIVYDQISHWITTIQQNLTNNDNNDNDNDQESLVTFSKKLETIQSKLGIATALAFTLVRVISFTKVTVWNFIPDCFQALRVLAGSTTLQQPKIWTIRFLMFACGGFNLLQLYWFYQIIQTATGNGNDDDDDGDETS